MDAPMHHAVHYREWVEAMHAALQANDEAAFSAAMRGFNGLHDATVMSSVRKVRGDLQAALERFRAESRLAELAEREVPDARQRLAHVIKLTDDAAHHTMDLVDQSCPLVDAISREAQRLQGLMAADAQGTTDATVQAEVVRFLALAQSNMKSVRARLSDVLLAQGYQDLSGQIIRNVMKLVDELEVALGDLVRIDSGESARERPAHQALQVASAPPVPFGPVVPGVEHGETVGGQQDVDAMLSGLGM
jgi:chemotaxis protein CheZ